ncbi:MAG: leucyl/phenylalanyl-tRNA--protein transferase [Bacteroidota bacterium]
MSLFVLDKEINFPPADLAEEDGLLAIGGDLSTERLLTAYRKGIFPWYEGDYILWWCPDPRFILIPTEMHVSKSMKALLKKADFTFTVNTAFKEVIRNCKQVKRIDQNGTWITDEMENAYVRLHHLGYAHSAEVWKDSELVGGLYGIKMGKVFFGESMFSLESNSSKFAFIKWVEQLSKEGIELIDCQVYTSHLESLGARMMDRKSFIMKLDQLIPKTAF